MASLLTQAQTLHELARPERRKALARDSLIAFGLIYLPHYFQLPPAEFHPELAKLMDDEEIMFLAVAGFRGSAKSTFAQMLIIRNAIFGKSKFILPINETDDVVKLTIANIRAELSENVLLINDFEHLIEKKSGLTKFTETNIVLTNGTRIMGRSRGQKIRGLRHKQHRPDLVVVDDPEELKSVKSKDYRDKTENWIKGDLIPSINETKARLIVVANVLHNDSLMPRLKKHTLFESRSYPLIVEGRVTWKGKYPTEQLLKQQEVKVGRTAWLREYLLKVVPDDGQDIKEEWIQRYKFLPSHEEIARVGIGIDFAISQGAKADYTVMMSVVGAEVDRTPKLFILPHPVHARLTFHETIETAKAQVQAVAVYGYPMFYPEDVGYQKAAIQEMERHMLPVTPMRVSTDKRARLQSIAGLIQNGTILFPEEGCEELITELVGFGVEEHDDLVDALVHAVVGIIQDGLQSYEVQRVL